VTITELWRYPVKTMAGEPLQRVDIGPLGITGDRIVQVQDARGRVVTSRSHPRFLSHRGSVGLNGAVLVDHRPWDRPDVTADVVTQLLGPTAPLNSDQLRYLDYVGNNNGSFDVGDFLAWVKATGAP